MTEAQIERLACLVAEKVKGTCQCNLDPKAQAEMGHFWGMLKDENNGNHGQGVESIRRVIQSEKKTRRIADIVAKVLITVTLTTFITALIAALWAGFKKAVA